MQTIDNSPTTGQAYRPLLHFEGKGGEYCIILLVNGFFTLLTLGLYSFWGKVKARKYIWSKLHILGEPLEYTGTGKELFVSFLIVMPVVLAGSFLISFLAQLHPVLLVFAYPLLLFLWEFASYRALRYRLTRTRWRGIRGNMSGSALDYAGKATLYWLAVFCSLGILMPWAGARMATIKLNNVWFGNRKIDFDGPAKELFKVFFLTYGLGLLLMAAAVGTISALTITQAGQDLARTHADVVALIPLALTLAVFFCFSLFSVFYRAAWFRWLCGHSAYGAMRFQSGLTGARLFMLVLTNILLLVFTLGIGWAWVHVRSLRLVCNSVEYAGDPGLEALLQDTRPAPSRGEGLLEALDMDIAL